MLKCSQLEQRCWIDFKRWHSFGVFFFSFCLIPFSSLSWRSVCASLAVTAYRQEKIKPEGILELFFLPGSQFSTNVNKDSRERSTRRAMMKVCWPKVFLSLCFYLCCCSSPKKVSVNPSLTALLVYIQQRVYVINVFFFFFPSRLLLEI